MALNKMHADLIDPPVIQASEKGTTEGKIPVLNASNCIPKVHIETGTTAGDIPLLGLGGKLSTDRIDTGVEEGQIIKVATGDKLPVIDGSNLTGLAAGGETNTGTNLGAGSFKVFKEKDGVDFKFRTIVAGANASLSQDDNQITIAGPTPGETNTASNVGGGEGVFKEKTGTDLVLRSIVAGSNVTLGDNDNDITISVPAPGETNTASNLGSGAGLFTEKSGVTIQLKSIVAGTGITIANNTNDITISASGGGGGYTPIAGAILQ